jgi:spore germination protein GerM
MRRVALLIVIVIALVAAACGLPEDSEPRAIPEDEVPPELDVEASTTSLPTGESSARLLYFVDSSGVEPRLVPEERRINEGEGIEGVLRALFVDPEIEQNVTRIPTGVELLGTELDENGTLTIDVSDEFGESVGGNLELAVAQVVLTVTEFDEVERVTFEQNGEPTEVPTNEVAKSLVSRCDYAEFDPNPSDCP